MYRRKPRLVGKVVNSMKGVKEEVVIKLNRSFIEFKGNNPQGLVPVNKQMVEEVIITNMGNDKVKFRLLRGAPSKRYDINFNPKDGIIKKKLTQTVQIQLNIRSTTKMSHVVIFELEGGQRFFIVLRAESEKSVFGMDVSDLDKVDDGGLQIPVVLVALKKYLLEHNGLSAEGIFRQPGDDAETMQLKAQLNCGTFMGCKDIYCISNLIKVWFRELPQQVLNVVQERTLSTSCETEPEVVAVYEKLPEPNKSLIQWLFQLLALTVSHETENKMNMRSLSIVVAPNLYSTESSLDGMQSFMLSTKVVNFTFHLLTHFYKLLKSPV